MIVTILDQRPRNPQVMQGSSIQVPGVVPRRKFALRVLLSNADLLDAGLTLRYAIQGAYDDQGVTWTDIFRGTFHGGQESPGEVGLPPQIEWQTSSPLPRFVRGELEWNQRVSIGLEFEIS